MRKNIYCDFVESIYNRLEQVLNIHATNRIAIIDLEWLRVKAIDIFALLSSLMPKNGNLLRVTIFPSMYRLALMNDVKSMHIEVSQKDGEINDGNSNTKKKVGMFTEKSRIFERSLFLQYYLIAEFDSKETANLVYTACDGFEFEDLAIILDLRFVPENQTFNYRIAIESISKLPFSYRTLVIFASDEVYTSSKRKFREEFYSKNCQNSKNAFNLMPESGNYFAKIGKDSILEMKNVRGVVFAATQSETSSDNHLVFTKNKKKPNEIFVEFYAEELKKVELELVVRNTGCRCKTYYKRSELKNSLKKRKNDEKSLKIETILFSFQIINDDRFGLYFLHDFAFDTICTRYNLKILSGNARAKGKALLFTKRAFDCESITFSKIKTRN